MFSIPKPCLGWEREGKSEEGLCCENAVAVVGAREVHRDGSSAAALSLPLGEEEGVPLA